MHFLIYYVKIHVQLKKVGTMKSIKKTIILLLVGILFLANIDTKVFAAQDNPIVSNSDGTNVDKKVVINLTYVTEDGVIVKKDSKTFTNPFVQHLMHEVRPRYIPVNEIEMGIYNFSYGVHEVTVPVKLLLYDLNIIPVDELGHRIPGYDLTLTGTYDEEINVSFPTIPHHYLDIESMKHRFTQNETYSPVYKKNEYIIKLNAVDVENDEVLTSLEEKANYGDFVSFELPELDGYIRYDDSRDHFVFGDAELKALYFRKDITLTINYELEDGTILESQSLTQPYKSDYSIKLENYPEYVVSSIDTDGLPLSGTMPALDQTFTIKLKRRPITNTVKFYDDLGNLVFAKKVDGFYGDSVKVTLPEIEGYSTQSVLEEIILNEDNFEIVSSSTIQRSTYMLTINYTTGTGSTILSKTYRYKYLDPYNLDLSYLIGYTPKEVFKNNKIQGTMPAYDLVIPVALLDSSTSHDETIQTDKLPNTGIPSVISNSLTLIGLGLILILIDKQGRSNQS